MSTEPFDDPESLDPEEKPAVSLPAAILPAVSASVAVAQIAPAAPDVGPGVGIVPSVAVIPPAATAFIEALPRPYVPKPRPVIIPERTERGFATAHVAIERAAARAFYITIKPADRPSQRVYLAPGILDGLLDLCASPALEPGVLWRRFCDIPLERPLPNRALEEELRMLLTTFSGELQQRAI